MKKLLCVVLSAIMIFGLSASAFAVQGDVYPEVYIHGLNAATLYADVDDPDSKMSFQFSGDLKAIIKDKLIPALVKYSVDRDIDAVASVIIDEIDTVIAPYYNNPDGTAKDNSGVILNYPQNVSKNSRCAFVYDWRGNPIEIAKDLNDYIDYVLSKSGSDKVAITCHSLGSIIAVSYLSLYGYDKVSGIVFDSPALYGASYIAELLSGEVELNGASLSNFLKLIMTETEYNDLVSDTLDVFELAGIPDMLAVFLEDVLTELSPALYKELLVPFFGRWLTIWAMCPDKYLDNAMSFVFDEVCKDEDLSALKGKIIEFNEKVREDKTETLLSFDEDGKIAVLSRYGFTAMPVTDSWNVMTDAVVDTSSTSFGAITANVGSSFDDKYLEGKDMSFVSPDRSVDASSCLFPDKTWFIKNAKHEDVGLTSPLYKELLFSSEELTCDTYKYSRFILNDNGVLVEDNTEPAVKEPVTPLARLFRFLRSIFDFILKLFKK